FGVAYPTEGMSHADLLEMAKAVTGDMNGTYVYGYGTRATTSEQYLNFVWNYGAQIVDPATMTPGTDSEAWKKGIQDYMAFYEAGTTPEGAASMNGTDLFSMFANGECAMFIAAVDYATALVADGWTEEKLGIAPLVGEDKATCYAGADVIAVPAGTAHEYEAGLLLNYLMGTELQVNYCKNVGFFPGTVTAQNDEFFQNDFVQAGFAATMSGAHYFDNYGVPSVGTILKEEIQRLIAGECDIDTYQANVTSRINEKIAEMNAG
ncbi:MAG: extracellular solute-binding protein, partial [Oscillospiraceae bacterium]|nr:extracellular solute-binding protein [Oscillospiraceae bacterium]